MTPVAKKRFHASLLGWFDAHRRSMPWRDTADPFAIWVSEVMLQQTRVEAVIPYFLRFMAAFPTPAALARADSFDVLKQWEGLGYYARARNLQKAARRVMDEWGGEVPVDRAIFRSLPGVGPYIEAAVGSIAFGVPVAAVDGNVKRVIARLLKMEVPVNGPRAHAAFAAPADDLLCRARPGDWNQAMMELGARICTPRHPDCGRCPAAAFCIARKESCTDRLPVRLRKKRPPVRRVAVGAVIRGNRLLICRRPETGLLGGLWELPGGTIEKGELASGACVREIREEVNLRVEPVCHLASVRHAYTHFTAAIDVFVCRVVSGRVRLRGPTDFAWIQPSRWVQYPFPGANRLFMPTLMAYFETQNTKQNDYQRR